MAQEAPPAATIRGGDGDLAAAAPVEGTGKDVYLCGGAELPSTLLSAGLIDEVGLTLELVTSTISPDGVLLLRHRVVREDSSAESPTGG